MIEIKGDLFSSDARMICITINSYVRRRDRTLVMGRGVALAAARLWPDLPEMFGRQILGGGCGPEPGLETPSR